MKVTPRGEWDWPVVQLCFDREGRLGVGRGGGRWRWRRIVVRLAMTANTEKVFRSNFSFVLFAPTRRLYVRQSEGHQSDNLH